MEMMVPETIGVIGAGSWGTLLAQMAALRVKRVFVWTRREEDAQAVHDTGCHRRYFPNLKLHKNIFFEHRIDQFFQHRPKVLIWALPSEICRLEARKVASWVRGDELLIHTTKGIESETLKRVSEVLTEELVLKRLGVLSGPNLTSEMVRGEPAGSVIATCFVDVAETARVIFESAIFRIYPEQDVIGVEWSGALKNIIAIASGALGAMKLGGNAGALLMSQGLKEMIAFGKAMGALEATFLGPAGIGDLFATCSSVSSRNYTVGYRLALGEPLGRILEDLGRVAEGVRTTEGVWKFASENGIAMPVTQAVYQFLQGKCSAREILSQVMS